MKKLRQCNTAIHSFSLVPHATGALARFRGFNIRGSCRSHCSSHSVDCRSRRSCSPSAATTTSSHCVDWVGQRDSHCVQPTVLSPSPSCCAVAASTTVSAPAPGSSDVTVATFPSVHSAGAAKTGGGAAAAGACFSLPFGLSTSAVVKLEGDVVSDISWVDPTSGRRVDGGGGGG